MTGPLLSLFVSHGLPMLVLDGSAYGVLAMDVFAMR